MVKYLEENWQSRLRSGCDEQVEKLRRKWPQAHYEHPQIGTQRDYSDWLIVIPSFSLPKGWWASATDNTEASEATICTVLMPIRIMGKTAGPLNGFFVDLRLRIAADKRPPHYARDDTPVLGEVEDHPDFRQYPLGEFTNRNREWDRISRKVMADRNRHWIDGHPQWRYITRFWWRAQMSDPNHDTLYTAAMLVRQRLAMVK